MSVEARCTRGLPSDIPGPCWHDRTVTAWQAELLVGKYSLEKLPADVFVVHDKGEHDVVGKRNSIVLSIFFHKNLLIIQ